MNDLQSDLEKLDLSKAGIFFTAGSVTQAGLEAETAKRVRAGMQDQYGWQLDECTAVYDAPFVRVTVKNGLKAGELLLRMPDELEVL